jgi:hypothetical protein
MPLAGLSSKGRLLAVVLGSCSSGGLLKIGTRLVWKAPSDLLSIHYRQVNKLKVHEDPRASRGTSSCRRGCRPEGRLASFTDRAKILHSEVTEELTARCISASLSTGFATVEGGQHASQSASPIARACASSTKCALNARKISLRSAQRHEAHR